MCGFIILIEKDWLSFGHQFGLRNGFCPKDIADIESSPIFLQWLDCVHQLMYQFPQAFEFNLEFLNFIATNIYSCLFGTFIYNSDKEREENEMKKTLSIWSFVFNSQNKKKFLNPFYKHNTMQEIIPYYSFYKLRIWEEYYFRYDQKENILRIKDNIVNDETAFDCESSKCEKNDTIIKDHYKFFEMHKKSDCETIKIQYENIINLSNIIKDMASIANKHHIIDELSTNSKEFIHKLDEIQIDIHKYKNESNQANVVDGNFSKLEEALPNNKINLLENYINNIENK